jgi:2-aminoethylphosphonate-pyruvate transaminase
MEQKSMLLPENPYLLLTPGPLSTSKTVKAAMLKDWCTWDNDYNDLVQSIRFRLVELATHETDQYTSVLMQGSGTFSVESVIGSVVPEGGKLLVITNGAYGQRMVQIAKILKISYEVYDVNEQTIPEPFVVERMLTDDISITHVAMVHCETTTGILNPVKEISELVKRHGKIMIVDAMSSFGGIPMDIATLKIDFLISSANKCIQGVPGFGFIIARRGQLEKCKGWARSHSLDLYDQWNTMEKESGKWRFTSPTHVVRAFDQALMELAEEGGVESRWYRYINNQRALVIGMRDLGFETLLPDRVHSPIITSFISPMEPNYRFTEFYNRLKSKGFVIYPGKVSQLDTFRIGNIGEIYQWDIEKLLDSVKESIFWK